MINWLFSFFLLAHGVAHMVYTSLAMGWLPPNTNASTWTGASWLLTGSLGLPATKLLGAAVFTAATLAFAITAAGLAFRQPWGTALLTWTAIGSSLALLLFWDGSFSDLIGKGAIGLGINIVLLVLLFVFRFPAQ
jgi:hypothetical protein